MLAEIASVSIAGAAIGSVYALMALAINVIFAARRIVNFAQGELVMLAGLSGITLMTSFNFLYLGAFIVASSAAAIAALVVERVAVRPLSTSEHDIAWILSIVAVSIVLSNLLLLMFTTDAQRFPSLVASSAMTFAGVRYVPDQLVAIGGAVAAMLALALVQERTMIGKAMKAVARDAEMASMLGISVNRYVGGAFALAGGMAGLTAFLVGPLTFVSAQLGFSLTIKGFAAAALGGLGTFRGAVLGGFVLGITETFVSTYVGSGLKDTVSLVALCVVLIFRPYGLAGEPQVFKV
jgi:branched-chain amino acid transport system permease protein